MEILFGNLESCFIYSMAILLSFLSVKLFFVFEKKSLLLKVFVLFVSIAPLSILFAFRDLSIGTDYYYYYNTAKEILLGDITFTDLTKYHGEFAFYFAIYLFSKISFDSIYLLLFLFSFSVYLTAFIGFYRIRDKIQCSYAWLFYLCVFYLLSYNILRQAVSVSIITLSLKYLFNKKVPQSIAISILASQFHSTSIIFVFFFAIYFIDIQSIAKELLLYVFVFIFLLILFNTASSYLGYSYYIDFMFDYSYLIQTFFLVLPFYYYASEIEKDKKIQNILLHFVLSCIVISSVSMLSSVAIRMLTSFQILLLLVGARILFCKNYVFSIYAISYFVVYQFLYIYLYSGSCETIPYYLYFEP